MPDPTRREPPTPMSFDDFQREYANASRETLLSMAHDYFRIMARLSDEQRDAIMLELDDEDKAENWQRQLATGRWVKGH